MARFFSTGMMTLICAFQFSGQQNPPTRSIDFRNFTFPFPAEELLGVPAKMKWMALDLKTTVTLRDGRYDFNKTDPSEGPSIALDRVLYGYLTSSKQLDAVVVLDYHTGGTAWWSYVYAFDLASNRPKLVGWLQAGSRADFGLYRLEVGNRSLMVDLLDPGRRQGDCCSDGFVRTRYTFRNGYFVQSGPREFGTIEASSQKQSKN